MKESQIVRTGTVRSAVALWLKLCLLLCLLSGELRAQTVPPWATSAAYDEARNQIVFFGGRPNNPSATTGLAETWIWDGDSFTQRSPATKPPATQFHSMTYDVKRQQAVLVLQSDIGSRTWVWDGTNWMAITPPVSPRNRQRTTVAYDKQRERVVLFGGFSGTLGLMNDTWEWDGSNWTEMHPADSPSARESHAMVYDEARQEIVMFGGRWPTGTWVWDGTNWVDRAPTNSPTLRGFHAMSYDPNRQRVVLFGGEIQAAPYNASDTWEWDGTNWTQVLPDINPQGRQVIASAFDPHTASLMIVGGSDLSVYNDAWFFNGQDWKLYGYPRVKSHFPAGQNGGYYTSSLTNIFVAFNRRMELNSFSTTNFQMQGPEGVVSSAGISYVSNGVYRIDFPSLTSNARYTVTLGPQLIDIDGLQLDQNNNTIPGEPDDGYSIFLYVDTIAPRVTRHDPNGDFAGTMSSVDIWFSEQMDTNTLSPTDVMILNPTNGAVSVSSIVNVGMNRFRFSFPPQTLPGLYHVLIGTNITDLAGNPLTPALSQPLSEGVAYDAAFHLVPVDLELSDVTANTNFLFSGDMASVSWHGRNNSGAPLVGSWIDAVYLSPDPFWNITDTFLGTVQHTGGLASNEVYSASLNFNVPGLSPGNYYLIVRADLGNQARETSEANNSAVSGSVAITVRQMDLGASLAGTLSPGNRYHYFAVNVPAGESLRLNLSGSGGVNHLFVSYGAVPTRLDADMSGTTASAGQTITLSGGSGSGTYYVLISGEQVGGDGNAYTLTADTASFFLTSMSPNQVTGGETLRFWVSLLESNQPAATIFGAGFDLNTSVQFVRSNGAAFTPSRTEFVSPTALHVFLPVNSWPPDIYSVQVTKGATTRTLTNGFTLLGGGEAKLEARVIGTALSPGGGQTIYVEFMNAGSRPMPTPLLKVTAYTNAIIQAKNVNWSALWAGGNFSIGSGSSSGRGGGGSVGRSYRVGVPLNTVQSMAIGSGGTPGILQPGESGRISVFFAGLQRDLGESQVQFSVGSVTADDTTVKVTPALFLELPDKYEFPRTGQRLPIAIPHPDGSTLKPFTIPWEELRDSSRPETAPTDGWNAVWSGLVESTGTLWPDYVLMLGDNLNHLARIGQVTDDPTALFNFEILQTTAALNPVRTLAGAVDASSPSPGFPLVFRRVYNQPILSRYKLGPLGRGWSHNWDITAQNLTQFRGLVISGPGGTDRFFGRNNNGSYTATGSDTGQLTVSGGTFRLIEADQTVWVFATNAPTGQLQYVEDPNGNRITCGYTGAQLTSLTHSSGAQFLLQYNGTGRITQVIDPVGRITTYEYDGSGEHLIRVTAPGNRVTTYAYHTTGIPQRLHALTNVTHPDLTQDSFAYDAQGRLIQTSQNCCGGAQQVTYAYDSAGTVTVTDATGRATQLLYGLGGQLAQVRDGEGRIVNFTYDDLAQLTQLLGPGGERYRYGYDGFGNLSGIEDPLRQVNNFTYEPNFNRLAQVRDARGNALQYAYDNRGNLTAITYADATAERFAYDASGNVVTSTNRRGGVITYAYNPAGQLTSKDYSTTPGLTDFTYAYDLAGNLTNATYWNPQLSTQESLNLRYDPFTDRLTRIEYPGGRFFAFDYDATGRRTRRADQDGHVTAYLYDALGRLARMTNELGQTIVNYDYDPAGRLSRKTLGNGVFTTYTYNQAGQVTQLVNSRADSNVLSSFSYTYDASGRRASMTTLAGTETYGYDPLGQLTSVTYPNSRVVNYAYDAAGNRTQVTDNGVPATYAANTLNQYTSAGAATFGYDLDGNLTNQLSTLNPQLSTTYTYDIENRLIGVATPADTWTYTYDAFGNRIAATHNGQTTRYVIDPTGLGNVAAEYDGGGSLIARYEHGFGLLARTDAAGDPAFYTFSAIGHTSELTDPSGAVANAYAYDPFGLSLAKTETIPNPFEFVGEFGVMNEGNGLEFMRARFYSAPRGNFLNPDPIGLEGGLNVYRYAGNSPVQLIDPEGLLDFVRDRDEFALGGGGGGGGVFRNPSDIRPPSKPEDFVNEDLAQEILDRFRDWRDEKKRRLQDKIDYEERMRRRDTLEDHAERWERQRKRLAEEGFILPPEPNPFRPEDEETSNVVRSRDPNDKLGPSGYGSAGYLPAGGVMAYQIRFENQPSATAPAQRVTVTDTLDPNLDLSTFELTEIAFANQTLALPTGLNHYETRLAFTVTNQTLIPLGDATVFALAPPSTNAILVEVAAHLDVPTRLLTLTLTALDPNTGWYPEDPLTGFLYPNDDTGRGDGSISFLVRPLSSLPTGATITNRADIIFDYNDPIITPQVLNTIDGHAPTSAVQPLPELSGRIFPVQWSAQEDPGGSGLAGVDVFVTVDGTNMVSWLDRTLATSGWFIGEVGHSYAFHTEARDNVGNVEAAPATPDAVTFVPTNAPILEAVTNFTAMPGTSAEFTNRVAQGSPLGSWLFSLGAGAPEGAFVNPTNGIFRWTPTCAQATTTNVITVWVTDTGRPTVMDAMNFMVVVGECVQPTLGQQVLLAGDSGRVPVFVISSVPLTNLQMTLVVPPGHLTDYGLQTLLPQICTDSIVPLSNGLHRLEFLACPGQWLIGTQQVAWLNFTAVSNQPSAFVKLEFTNLLGVMANGTLVANFASQSGRVVIVGEEPLLEALSAASNQVQLLQYAIPGSEVTLQWTPYVPPVEWSPFGQVTQTNLVQEAGMFAPTGPGLFFRAVRTPSGP